MYYCDNNAEFSAAIIYLVYVLLLVLKIECFLEIMIFFIIIWWIEISKE